MLVSGAITYVQQDVGWLSDVRFKGDGTFEGLDAAYARIPHADFQHSGVLILTRIIELLVLFIGLDLTQTVIQETWPQVPIEAVNLRAVI